VTKILFDTNNLAIRCVMIGDVTTTDKKTKEVTNIDWDYWKLAVFQSIYSSLYKVKDVKTVVLAIDDKHSWRYDVFPRYKEDRKKKKTDDNFPWDLFFLKYQEFIEEIQNHLPFKVISVTKAEGDDIIGTIALDTPDPSEVVSNDKDFLQLCSGKVKLYNPSKQEHTIHPDPKFFLVEQCFLGQAKDSIFNIITPSDWPEGKRKPGFGPKAFEKAVEYGWKEYIKENKLEENFKRNLNLIDLSRTPADIKKSIMDSYNNYVYPHPEKIWQFIKSNNWPDMIDNFTQVESKLMSLY
jgi:hypothetical protein